MENRRDFLKKTAGMMVAPALPTSKPAAHRKAKVHRRIIYNNDGDDLSITAFGVHAGPDYPSRFDSVGQYLSLRTKKLAGGQVDTIFYCGYTERPDWELPQTNIAVLGPNPLKPVVDFAHHQGMEFFYSLRMNDIHSAFTPGPGQWPKFKLENAHLLQANVTQGEFGKKYLPWIKEETKTHPLADVRQRRGGASRDFMFWSGYDWSYPEVRAHFLDAIEGACQRYDLEGIELDWGRHPAYFKFGDEQHQVPVMNDFMRLVKQRLRHFAQKRGRPILLCVRVADTPALSYATGLDVETWIREGLVDMVAAGYGYMPFSCPLEEWIKLTHARGIPCYGVVERAVLPAEPVLFRDAIRAAAYRYWQAGVDGLYLFNLFFKPGDTDCLKEVGDPQLIARQNKLYQIDRNWRDAGFLNLTSLPGQVPCLLTNAAGANSVDLKLEIADDPHAAAKVTVLVRMRRDKEIERVSFTLNGRPLLNPHRLPPTEEYHYPFSFVAPRPGEPDPSKLPKPGWVAFETDALIKGMNQLRVTLRPPRAGEDVAAVEVGQVRVAIAYA